MKLQHFIHVRIFRHKKEWRRGLDILLLSLIRITIEISQGTHPNIDILVMMITFWKVSFSFQVLMDWR